MVIAKEMVSDRISMSIPLREPMSLEEALNLKPGDNVHYIYPHLNYVFDQRMRKFGHIFHIATGLGIELVDEFLERYERRCDVPLIPLTVGGIRYGVEGILWGEIDRLDRLIRDSINKVEIFIPEFGVYKPYIEFSIAKGA